MNIFDSYEDYMDFRLNLYQWRLDKSEETYRKAKEKHREDMRLDLL